MRDLAAHVVRVVESDAWVRPRERDELVEALVRGFLATEEGAGVAPAPSAVAGKVRDAVYMFAGYLSACETLPATRGPAYAWGDLARDFVAKLTPGELGAELHTAPAPRQLPSIGPRAWCPNCLHYGYPGESHRCEDHGGAKRGLDGLAAAIGDWQRETFPTASPLSTREHLRRELRELAESPLDASEMADVFHLLVAVANASNVDLVAAVSAKFLRNRRRTWGKPDALGVVEHVREGGES